jgi:hypothetical protein
MPIPNETRLDVFNNENKLLASINTSENDDSKFNMTTSLSIDDFPIMKISVQLTKQFAEVHSYGKEIEMMVRYFDKTKNAEYIMFRGSYFKDTISMDKGKEFPSIEMVFVHPFFKTTFLGISKREFNNTLFIDFLRELIDHQKISTIVIASEEIKTIKINGFVNKLNSFRLIKEICIQNTLNMNFKEDGSIEIEKKGKLKDKIMSQTPITISDNDFINLKGEQSIL